MKHSTQAMILALTCLVAFACAPPAEEPPPVEEPAEPRTTIGEIWRWVSLSGTEPREVADPGLYTLELMDDGRYHVQADCNHGTGNYTLEGDRLSLGPARMTMAACGPGSLDGQFLIFLADVATIARAGDRLTVSLGTTPETLEFEMQEKLALPGTAWLVRGYNNGKQAVVGVTDGTTLNVEFSDDGVTGSAGCNNFNATREVAGERMTIGPVAATRKMCEGVMEQEAAFLSALETVATWEVRGNRLQMRTTDGALAVDLIRDSQDRR